MDQAGEQRLKISENLHDSMINDLRRHLGIVLSGKKSLTLLIDGLDEPWGPGEHVTHLAELIAGLLGVAQFIPDDFKRSDDRVRPVALNITVLLRSDMFAFIQHLLPEQDKLPIVQVIWNDQELLLRVLEERMLLEAPRERTPSDVWAGIFPDSVVGLTSKEFILVPFPLEYALYWIPVSPARHSRASGNPELEVTFQYRQDHLETVLRYCSSQA